MPDEYDAQDQPTELNADDFVKMESPPDRESCRRLLDNANGNAEKIAAWNRLRAHFHDWIPDISSEDDPWITINYNYNANAEVFIDLSNSILVKARLSDVRMRGADLRNANLQGAMLGEARLNEARMAYANLKNCDLRWTDFSGATLMHAKFGTPLGDDSDEQSILKIGSNAPFFTGANLAHAVFGPAIIGGGQFQNAILSYANLEGANIEDTDFQSTNLTFVNFRNSTIRNSNFNRSNFELTDFEGAILAKTTLGMLPTTRVVRLAMRFPFVQWLLGINRWATKMLSTQTLAVSKLPPIRSFNSWFVSGQYAMEYLNNSTPTTTLDDADLRTCTGLVPNGQSARGTRFAARAKDPYSIVRRKYTGPMLFFHMLFLVAFFTPYIVRAGAWTAVERIESSELATQIESSSAMQYAPEMVDRSVLWVVLGFSSGFWGIFAGVLSIIFVFYNIIRAIMTWWMSQVRDAEERSGHLPEIQEYWWCYTLHTYFMRWVFWAAVLSFVFHAARWMSTTVAVPAAFA